VSTTDILDGIVAALRGELGAGFAEISSLVNAQGTLLAVQAEHITTSRLSGSLKDDDELFGFFLDGLRKNAENLAKSVVMLSALTIEKAWNAIAGTVWAAIRGTLAGAGVPSALLPATPPIHI
jgi:hypothetical protein